MDGPGSGRKERENSQSALRSREVKRLYQGGTNPKPISSACTLGFPGLSFALTTN